MIIRHIQTQNGKLCVFIRPPSFPVLPPRGTPSATPSPRNHLIHLTLPRAIRYLLPRETIPFALQNHTYCLPPPPRPLRKAALSAPQARQNGLSPHRRPSRAAASSAPQKSRGWGAETPPPRPAIYHNGDWWRAKHPVIHQSAEAQKSFHAHAISPDNIQNHHQKSITNHLFERNTLSTARHVQTTK